MKKGLIFTLIAALVAVISILFYSCRKKESLNTDSLSTGLTLGTPTAVSHTNVVLENGYLYFDTKETFFSILEDLDTTEEDDVEAWETYYSGFTSMRSYWDDIEESTEADTFMCPTDDVSLSSVLNMDGILRIDSVAFLLDFAAGHIYEVYPVNEATIDSLKLKNEINNDSMYVFRYSLDDNVLYPDSFEEQSMRITNDGRMIPVNNHKRLFRWLKKVCGLCPNDNNKYAREKDYKNTYGYDDQNDECVHYRYIYKLKYQRCALRFTVIAKVKHQKKDGCSGHWRRESGSVCFDASLDAYKFCSNFEVTSWGHCDSASDYGPTKWKKYFYNKPSALGKYKLNGTFYFREMDDPHGKFPHTTTCDPNVNPQDCPEIQDRW